jgi:hypothetical protein
MTSLIKNPPNLRAAERRQALAWMHYASEFWSLSADAGQERKRRGGQRNPLKRLKMDKGIKGDQSLFLG